MCFWKNSQIPINTLLNLLESTRKRWSCYSCKGSMHSHHIKNVMSVKFMCLWRQTSKYFWQYSEFETFWTSSDTLLVGPTHVLRVAAKHRWALARHSRRSVNTSVDLRMQGNGVSVGLFFKRFIKNDIKNLLLIGYTFVLNFKSGTMPVMTCNPPLFCQS